MKNIISQYIPNKIYKSITEHQFSRLSKELKEASNDRIHYYYRLRPEATLEEQSLTVATFSKYVKRSDKKYSTYCYDLYPIVRLFKPDMRFAYAFGDVNHETSIPAFTKARPIISNGQYSNSVIMRLNSIRHFVFVNDKMEWGKKTNQLVFRNVVEGKPHRIEYLLKTFDNPLCDSGETPKNAPVMPDYAKPYLTMEEMLKYKFIACIEGNEVATNLKWVMSSNSIAVMPRPKFESWFMEATLIPDYHYIEIKDDYSNITEKLTYYISHPDEALAIIAHAHEYVEQFKDKRLEKWIQYQVARKYFEQVK